MTIGDAPKIGPGIFGDVLSGPVASSIIVEPAGPTRTSNFFATRPANLKTEIIAL